MYEIVVKEKKQVEYLLADCGVRYWEDSKVNGVQDNEDNPSMPMKVNDCWHVLINLETGIIKDWPAGVTAEIHYKICDDGTYKLLDENLKTIIEYNGYVPAMMCPEGNGWGDYIIMNIDENGKIANWKVNIEDFQEHTS